MAFNELNSVEYFIIHQLHDFLEADTRKIIIAMIRKFKANSKMHILI
ncbi:hypothetical protein KKE26_01885 [bacterium]|nr:hypothetical protein [bacterium]MBU1753262.1 hypothetical protein [bacterium]